MKAYEYIANAVKTESNDYAKIRERLQHNDVIRLLHAGMGMQTESGEFTDALKKYIFYGKPLDVINLAEEIGDLFWYVAIVANTLEIDFETIFKRNIDKLKKRYGNKFNETGALHRDLDAEREILEKK